MDQIQKVLFNLYTENLVFLEKEFPHIYKRILMLDDAISKKVYQPKWSLEYIEKEDYFDVLNLETNEYLYGKNSFSHSDTINEETTYDNKSSFDMLYKENNKFTETKKFKTLIPLVKYINDVVVDTNNVKYKKLYKFIFFGAGLGLHINKVFTEKAPLTTLIIEPDLEIFRLSLFITNYSKLHLNDHTLFLSVGDDIAYRRKELGRFYKYHVYFNFHIKYQTFLKSHKYLIDEALNYLSIESIKGGILELMLLGIKRTKDYLSRDYKFIDLNKFQKTDNPVLILSGGPSLDKHLDWIEKNQKYFTIISINLMANKLIENKIIPDIIVITDPGRYVYETLEKIKDKSILNNTICISNSHVSSKATDLFCKENLYFIQAIPFLDELEYPSIGNNVGMFALCIAIHMNFSNIYTLGNDCAFDSETGSVYSSGSYFDSKITKIKDTEDKTTIHHRDVITTKGNFIDEVSTTRNLLSFKTSAEHELEAMSKLTENKNLFNLSNGAYINGLTPFKVEDIQIQEDSKDSELLNELFANSLSNKINMENKFKYDIDILNFIKNKLTKDKKKQLTSINDFLQLRLAIYTNIIKLVDNSTTEMTGKMYHELTNVFDNYINYYFTIDFEITVENINDIKEYWLDGFIYFTNELIDIYKD